MSIFLYKCDRWRKKIITRYLRYLISYLISKADLYHVFIFFPARLFRNMSVLIWLSIKSLKYFKLDSKSTTKLKPIKTYST